MEHLQGSNNPKRSKTFDMEDHLPLLFQAFFAGAVFKTWRKKVRSLVGITLIARSSDVIEYCPEFDRVEYPEDTMDYMAENIPKSLIMLVFKNWKDVQNGTKCRFQTIRFASASTHNMFCVCPVYWLFQEHWSLRWPKKEIHSLLDRLLSTILHTSTWGSKTLFKSAGLGTCSSHSVRWSTTQWARRCGADILAIQNIGLWVCNLCLPFWVFRRG
jgi:hypothetical protein